MHCLNIHIVIFAMRILWSFSHEIVVHIGIVKDDDESDPERVFWDKPNVCFPIRLLEFIKFM